MIEKSPNRAVDRIVRVDLNNFDGALLERWKANVLNKKIGLIMIKRMIEWFGVTSNELATNQKDEFNEELQLQKKLLEAK
jgi:hypothetical protein